MSFYKVKVKVVTAPLYTMIQTRQSSPAQWRSQALKVGGTEASAGAQADKGAEAEPQRDPEAECLNESQGRTP